LNQPKTISVGGPLIALFQKPILDRSGRSLTEMLVPRL
jgi:hypothetical protein